MNSRRNILKLEQPSPIGTILVKRNNFSSLPALKLMFPTADQVGKLTVFNVGGNKVRLITAIHYNRKRIYIRAVLTHDEYDRGKWKE